MSLAQPGLQRVRTKARTIWIAGRWRLAPGRLRAGLTFAVIAGLTLAASLGVRAGLSRALGRHNAAVLHMAAVHGFTDRDLAAMMTGADPGVVRFTLDHNPDGPQAAWARPPGWKRLDVETPPTLTLDHLSMAQAQKINGIMPNTQFLSPPATPFVLRAGAGEKDKAVGCLTAAIYYEAALEPREGQEAVAQVVINRMRHAGYPKSICGVVFQGSDQPGCQFSFACDGSMARPPAAWAWKAAHDVAQKALDGFVMKAVGVATHYHTDWIIAAWTPTLVKVGKFGSHIFFRPTGPDGAASAFEESYRGGEARAARLDQIGKPAPAAGLQQASVSGSVAAPTSVVRGGKLIMLAPGTVVSDPLGGDPQRAQPPMHAMISMREAVARAMARGASISMGDQPVDLDAPAAPVRPPGRTAPAQAPVARSAGQG